MMKPAAHDDLRRPLTQAQHLLWTGQQLHPEAPLYNMALAFTLRGPLDADAFARAVQATVDRSDALRTVVETAGGVPLQRVREALDLPVEVIDLSQETDPEASARAWLTARAREPFDLSARLIDTALLRLGAGRHVWFLNHHHLITDAWSTGLVYRSVADLYRRALDGSLDDVEPLPAYADYLAYEAEHRSSRLAERAAQHWAERARAMPEPVRLYGAQARRPSTDTVRVTRALGAERSARLRALAQSDGALTEHVALFNRFAVLLAAFLHRASGQDRVAFGTPSHNRPTAALKETVGLFIEVFPLVADVQAGETFATLLDAIRRESGMLLRYAQPGASTPALHRRIGAVLNYITADYPDFAGLEASTDWLHAGHGDAAHHLRLQVHDFDATGAFTLHLDLNAALFDADQRERAADHLVALLDAMLADETQRIGAVDLLAADEHEWLEALGRGDQMESAGSVVEAFDAQTAQTPSAVAVQDGDRVLSYRDLQRKAEALAAVLRGHGAGPDVRVALALGRSLEAVVGILAAWKAGSAYVPLDLSHPPARLRDLIVEAQPVAVLSRRDLVDALPDTGAPVVLVEDDHPEADGGYPPDARDLAYVLYTSGSTGQPKGVMIEHGALAHYAAWAAERYGGGRPTSMPLFTSLGFDLTVTSLVVPLLTGGRIVVYPEGDAAATLLTVVEDDSVDALKLTPSHLSLLRGRAPSERVRHVIVGGEALSTAQARAAHRAFGGGTVDNEYGPTEATVGCVVYRLDPGHDPGDAMPIGRPAPGMEVVLLTPEGARVPLGTTGEIALGGPQLARGYLGRPGETAARFVECAGRRLYRTGDLGRWRADGTLEYLGREDEQVKVGGVRVELGEVEAAVAALPGVEAVAVAAITDRRSAVADHHCTVCGLPSTYPGATFDDAGACHLCRGYDAYAERVRHYFRSMDDLRTVLTSARARTRADYDVLMLLSGGKDSTYALARLAEMGTRVLAFTLDNGYLSDEAKANIRRVTDTLGVDHVWGSTPAMNAIFVDSLERHSNVCQGCFKTIYTLAIGEARRRGIPVIVTGLSRGQFFETRLTEDLFASAADADAIDATVLEARKAYHRVDDAVRRLLDTDALQKDAVFDEVQFVDFYRYCDVSLDEMMAYLDVRVPWVRPDDTGRSTNCLINEAGIWVHKREQGYHNYAFPYAWDVRVGHKTRDETLDELDDDIDEANVRRMLREIGYDGDALDDAPPTTRLVAYVVGEGAPDEAALRAALAERLPAALIPSAFVRLDALPLTANGKLDRSALPDPRPDGSAPAEYVAPRSDLEADIAAVWADVLGIDRVSVTDDFLAVGGHSLLAIQIIARINRAYGVDLPLQSAFEAARVEDMAVLVEDTLLAEIEGLSDDEATRLASD